MYKAIYEIENLSNGKRFTKTFTSYYLDKMFEKKVYYSNKIRIIGIEVVYV